jgi:hypothetical protein
LTDPRSLSIIDTSKIDKELVVSLWSRLRQWLSRTPAADAAVVTHSLLTTDGVMPRRPLQPIRRLLTAMLWLDAAAVVYGALQLDTGATGRFEVLPSVVFGNQPHVVPTTNSGLWIDTVGVTVQDPGAYQRMLDAFAHGLPFALATVPMLIIARRLVDRAVATHPFTAETARGLRRLGVVVLAAGAAAEVVRVVATQLLYRSAVDGGGLVTPPVALWWLPLGLVLLGFAQIVDHGRRLRAELDEVI